MDSDRASGASLDDVHARLESARQALCGRTVVNVRSRLLPPSGGRSGLGRGTRQRLDLTRRQTFGDDPTGKLRLLPGVAKSDQRSSLAGSQRAVTKQLLNAFRQAQQTPECWSRRSDSCRHDRRSPPATDRSGSVAARMRPPPRVDPGSLAGGSRPARARASSSSEPTARTTTGTSSRPAFRAARQRRSPATIE